MSFNLFRPDLVFTIMLPAEISTNKDIQNIALVDRVGNEASKEAISLLYRDLTLITQPRFQVRAPVNAQRSYNALKVSDRVMLEKKQLSRICSDIDVDAVVFLESLTVMKDEFQSSRTESRTSYETVTRNGKEESREVTRDVEIIVLSMEAEASSSWVFQDCTGAILDDYSFIVSDSWTEEGETLAEVAEILGNKEELLDVLASSSGPSYLSRISPYEQEVKRDLYRWGGKDLREGNKALKNDQVEKAKKHYRKAIQTANKEKNLKNKGKALLNMAILQEKAGNIPQAAKDAARAHRNHQGSLTEEYLQEIRTQRRNHKQVQAQLDKAQQSTEEAEKTTPSKEGATEKKLPEQKSSE
ncbi:MAG: hypothetical protein CMK59_09470 [Proteobacteria bacterium]|nr:hypothetical protein [Pseudomonadota bacterium]